MKKVSGISVVMQIGIKKKFMQEVNSHIEFIDKIKTNENSYLLLYKKGSETGNCSLNNLQKAYESIGGIALFCADVNTVRDIHEKYGISTVPALLYFKNDKLISIYKGCNDVSFYESVFKNSFYSANSDKKSQKSVIVYSTPSCSWCTRLKTYLRENEINYKNIDVSKDQKAAEEMVKRSGQQGVPQTLINGQLVMGFDKAKIDKLLNLR